jgi:hypothetical protein
MRTIFAGRNVQIAPIADPDFAQDIKRDGQQAKNQHRCQADDRLNRAKKPAPGKQRNYWREKEWVSANGKRSRKLFLAGQKSRAIKESKNAKHSVRYRSRLAMSARELSATAYDHPNQSADQRADHHQHEQHAARKSGAYAIDSAISVHARRFLATLAGKN